MPLCIKCEIGDAQMPSGPGSAPLRVSDCGSLVIKLCFWRPQGKLWRPEPNLFHTVLPQRLVLGNRGRGQVTRLIARVLTKLPVSLWKFFVVVVAYPHALCAELSRSGSRERKGWWCRLKRAEALMDSAAATIHRGAWSPQGKKKTNLLLADVKL